MRGQVAEGAKPSAAGCGLKITGTSSPPERLAQKVALLQNRKRQEHLGAGGEFRRDAEMGADRGGPFAHAR